MHFCLYFLKEFKYEEKVLDYIEKIISLYRYICKNEYRFFAEDENGILLYKKLLDDINFLYNISSSIENFIEKGKENNIKYKEPENKEELKIEINNLILEINNNSDDDISYQMMN